MEDYIPNVKYGAGIRTNLDVSVGDNATVTLPSTTTIGGSSVVALGNITGSNTTGVTFSVTNTGIYTGTGLDVVIANSATTGTVSSVTANGLTSGHAYVISSTGTIVTTGDLLSVIGNSATTSTGLVRVSATGMTTGNVLQLLTTSGTLTTGRYLSANNSTTEVFGIGLNGHIISTVSASPPTIAVTTQAGITAAAITAGGSDTCGLITTTGTSTGSTQLTVTFGKTYTTAPKSVQIAPANAAAAAPNTAYYVDNMTATTFRITVAAGGTYAATPSWSYQVIA